jgi:hypothetical protein
MKRDKADKAKEVFDILSGVARPSETFVRVMTLSRPAKPCGDCMNGYCVMNCGPAEAAGIKSEGR